MPDYQPIGLAAQCNVGADFVGDQFKPHLGRQDFHGLPFEIAEGERCFIGFPGTAEDQAVTIPVDGTARYLIFAHALLESDLFTGGAMGQVVAHYVVTYADGERLRLPVRERFEVAVVPTAWGQWAFRAMPDHRDGLQPRHEGHWGGAGFRQAEVTGSRADAYYLWAWHNPCPDKEIKAVTVEPAGKRFLVAAVTLGQLDEDPLRKFPKYDVRITVTDAELAAAPFDLAVEVDRGVATFPFPLPQQDADSFLNDARAGWGEAANNCSNAAYVEIAARPSASVVVKHGSDEIGRANWGELREAGAVATGRCRIEVVDHGRNWVHVTVVDDDTDEPVPCRLHFRSPEGIPYQPHGHHNQVNRNLGSWHQDVGGDLRLGQVSYAYIDGKCQGWLPRGEVIIDAARGYEYEPLRQRVAIAPGQRTLELRLKRWRDMNAAGWFSGDSHVHFLGSQGAHREAQGEDLNVVNLLQSQWGHLFTNTEDFTGGPTLSQDGRTIVYCTQENRQHILGHLTLLGLKEPVMPWCSDGPSEAELGGHLEVTLSRWADACHDQGGTVIIPHLPNPNGEPAALIATGRADAIEMLTDGSYNHVEYYRYLNCGYKLPIVGGTDKMTSDVPVGIYRTYAKLAAGVPFDYDSWCAAVRAGRTFLSGGPLLSLSVDGHEIGDTVSLPGNGGTIEITARAESIFPIHTLQIVCNGKVVASTDDDHGQRVLALKTQLKIDRHSWLTARCGGPKYCSESHHDGWHRGIFAHTSPIYFAVGEPWWMFDADTAQYMLTTIGGCLEHIRHMVAHHDEGQITHHHHVDDHLTYLEEPFHQAAAAIHKRMHELGLPH